MLSMNNLSKSATGFFLGGMIAAAVALLYAPQSGEETRREIGEKALQTRQHLVESAEELQGRTQKLFKGVEEEMRYKGSRLKRIGSNTLNEQKSSLEHGAKEAMTVMKT